MLSNFIETYYKFGDKLNFFHRGFFTCLDEDGNVFDETKYIWLQARQVWMYMRLRNEVERYKNNEQLYHAAVKGKAKETKKSLQLSVLYSFYTPF